MNKKIALWVIVIYLAGIAAIWWDGFSSVYENSEYAVVLGNQVYTTGEPSERLKARLNRAAELYNQGIIKKIIVSGGLGTEGFDEAIVMSDYLQQQTIPATHIIIDSNGYTTRMTAQNAEHWMNKDNPIIVVSQLYHLSRSKMAFEQAGFNKVGAAYPEYFERRDILSSVRELMAWLFYRLGGK